MKGITMKRKGFTLVEILVVIGIIATLIIISIGIASHVTRQAKIGQTRTSMAVIMAALGTFYDLYGRYPDDDLDPYNPDSASQVYQGLAGPDSPSKCRDQLAAGLPKGAVGTDPKSGTEPRPACFLDSFGGRILFYSSRAKGGAPLLVSTNGIYSDGR